MIDILRTNNFNTPDIRNSDVYVSNKRAKQTQRRILKGFNISTVDIAIREAFAKDANTGEKADFFKTIAKAISNKSGKLPTHPSELKGSMVDPIGSTRTLQESRMASFRRTILARGGSQEEINKLSAAELVHINPLLKNYTPTTRLAYAKFKSFVAKDFKVENSAKDKFEQESETSKRVTPTLSRLSSFVEKNNAKSSLSGSLSGSLTNLAIKEELESEKSPEKALAPAPPTPQQVAEKLDKKLIEFSPEGSEIQNVMQIEEATKKPCEIVEAPVAPEIEEPTCENQSETPSNQQEEKEEKPPKSPEKIVSPRFPTRSVKLLSRQFSQEVPEGVAPNNPKPIISKGPKVSKIATEFSPPRNGTGARKKKAPTPPASKVFPEAEERAILDIQSPLNSPTKDEPPSPLPPKNVPLSMDTLLPYVDSSESGSPVEEKTPEPKPEQVVQPEPEEGKSVITGQVRSGWL